MRRLDLDGHLPIAIPERWFVRVDGFGIEWADAGRRAALVSWSTEIDEPDLPPFIRHWSLVVEMTMVGLLPAAPPDARPFTHALNDAFLTGLRGSGADSAHLADYLADHFATVRAAQMVTPASSPQQARSSWEDAADVLEQWVRLSRVRPLTPEELEQKAAAADAERQWWLTYQNLRSRTGAFEAAR
jgi:hypothetical protein